MLARSCVPYCSGVGTQSPLICRSVGATFGKSVRESLSAKTGFVSRFFLYVVHPGNPFAFKQGVPSRFVMSIFQPIAGVGFASGVSEETSPQTVSL